VRRPTRVLLVEVNEDGTVGGSHQYLFDLVRSLDPERFTPLVLFYQENRFAQALRAKGVRTIVWEPERIREVVPGGAFRRTRQVLGTIGAIVRRVRLLRQEGVELLHMNSAPGIGFDDWLPAAKLCGIPAIAHAHLQYPLPRRRVWRRLTQSFDAVVAISGEIQRFLIAQGIPERCIVRITNGIDADGLRARVRTPADEVRRALGVPPGQILVAMVGHLRPWKGQNLVLEAICQLPAPVRRTLRLVIIGGVGKGNEAYYGKLQQMVRGKALEDCVSFLGERTDAPDLMQAADIILHASTTPEPFGLVVLEGMALGKAVIASGIGGPTEIITPGTGLLFDPTRPRDLAHHLTSLAGSPETRQRLGESARIRAEDFSLDGNVAAVERLYTSLLQRASSRQP